MPVQIDLPATPLTTPPRLFPNISSPSTYVSPNSTLFSHCYSFSHSSSPPNYHYICNRFSIVFMGCNRFLWISETTTTPGEAARGRGEGFPQMGVLTFCVFTKRVSEIGKRRKTNRKRVRCSFGCQKNEMFEEI